MMKNMWAIILLCRSTIASLAEHRERWIASRLVFRDWAIEGSYLVWTLIGVDSTVSDLIVTMQLRVVAPAPGSQLAMPLPIRTCIKSLM